LYYLFDTIGIYHCKIYKILAYYINHIGINSGIKEGKSVRYRLTITENVITCYVCFEPLVKTAGGGINT